MFKTQHRVSVWLLLGFIFVEMFTMHVYPLLRESVSDASVTVAGARDGETVRATEFALPVQDGNDGLADHCCVCSCTHMLISEPAYRAFFNEVPSTYAIGFVAFAPDPPPGSLTPPPKFS